MFGSEPWDAGRPWFSEPGPVVGVAAGVELVSLRAHRAEWEPHELPLLGQVRPTKQLTAEEVGGHGVAAKAEVALGHQAAGPCVCPLVLHRPDEPLQRGLLETLEHCCRHVPPIILSIALLRISALQLPQLLHKLAPPASEHKHVC